MIAFYCSVSTSEAGPLVTEFARILYHEWYQRGGALMSSIIVRGLDPIEKRRLAAQAKEHGRSIEAEVRDILTRATTRPHIGLALLHAAREFNGVDELQTPERTDPARVVDFG